MNSDNIGIIMCVVLSIIFTFSLFYYTGIFDWCYKNCFKNDNNEKISYTKNVTYEFDSQEFALSIYHSPNCFKIFEKNSTWYVECST